MLIWKFVKDMQHLLLQGCSSVASVPCNVSLPALHRIQRHRGHQIQFEFDDRGVIVDVVVNVVVAQNLSRLASCF